MPSPIQNDSIVLLKTSVYLHAKNKLHNSLLSYSIIFQRILQFDWLAAFWPITWDSTLCQTCWWNINNNISLHYRLFSRKTNMTKFFKKSPKPYFGPILGLLSKFGPKKNFPGKRALSVFQYSNSLPLFRKSEKPNEPFLRKLLDRHTKNQFISLISLWDTANFFVRYSQWVLRLIENPAIWLVKSILAISFGPEFFQISNLSIQELN